ncbi:MAG: hypothetical protein LBT40_05335 [Deltaproteobacteria bacterium]|nr:hypothetical protein [Deltaproteobacteria bacterium]
MHITKVINVGGRQVVILPRKYPKLSPKVDIFRENYKIIVRDKERRISDREAAELRSWRRLFAPKPDSKKSRYYTNPVRKLPPQARTDQPQAWKPPPQTRRMSSPQSRP